MTDATYVIGIDLGTTNSVVAYTEVAVEKGHAPDIRILRIPQLVAAGTVEQRPTLPSFLFLPGGHDVAEGALGLPWDPDNDIAVGEFARDRGAEIPQRLVSSSKSWLCHTAVDRNKPILPWQAPEEVARLSPVEAGARILSHIRDAWNHLMASGNDHLRMEFQDVLITVPASFDAVARELTIQAAAMAGLTSVTLLEEPQAAFYSWIQTSGEEWREKVRRGDTVLVCDVGGGTTDFSLIQVSEEDGDLVLDRVAVGDHLLVGGDNMDLALAWAVANEMTASGGKKLDSWQMRGLWHACRKAKETLLADADAPSEFPVTILGRGSGLIGGTRKSRLTGDTVSQVVLEGFFPQCERSSMPVAPPRTGIQEVGLTYEADPAITRHLARFLSRKRNGADAGLPPLPTAVLFNGGVMKAGMLRSRILEILAGWARREGAGPVREIDNTDFDLTVARGAAYYGLARRGEGIRIRGGLNRTYYVGVAAALPAVPGMPVPIRAVCVATFGMEEGTQARLPNREFVLLVGEPVKFDFLGSSVRLNDQPGTVVDEWEDDIEPLATIETSLDGETGSTVPVMLEARVTEIGTLELWCVAVDDAARRWKLEFNVRDHAEG